MIINKQNIDAVFKGLNLIYNQKFKEVESLYEQLATTVPSSTSSNDYYWIGELPAMKEWIDERQLESLAAYKYTIFNRKFENTVKVKQDDLADDNIGILKPQVEALAQTAKQFPDVIVADLLNNAFSSKCFDGQYFVDTDHQVAGNSVSNKGTQALSAEDHSKADASLGEAIRAMSEHQDNHGEPMGIKPNLLVVPPALRFIAKQLCNQNKLLDDKPNVFQGEVDFIVNPRLKSSTAWFLLDTTQPLKPLIYQEREKPTAKRDDSELFMRGAYFYGVKMRCNGGYGFWQTAYGSTGAA